MPPVDVALILVLPQVAGFAVSRLWRWMLTWPLVAVATFCGAWHGRVWAPLNAAAARDNALHHVGCGMWMVVGVVTLLAGVVLHVVGGTLLGWLDRRAQRAFVRPSNGPG